MTAITSELSGRYVNDPQYLATPGHVPRYTTITARRTDLCAECVQRQHETRGQARRRPPRFRRTAPSGAVLLLCDPDADAWRTRDADDAK